MCSNFKYVLNPLALAIMVLIHPTIYAAESDSTDDKKVEKVVRVAVTGSRIAKAEKEGPTSVTVITAADIEKQGFSNVFDALNNLAQNTGFVQGADFGNTYTPAANAISLKGLGPNHTLTLINGRRVADYPVPYDGQTNFTNLANIPTAIVERIEILNSGASAIYGSDAIAGVVNIILKKKTDGTQVNIKAGGTTHGGGETGRLQLSGSHAWDKLSAVYAVELSAREPIFATDRSFMSTRIPATVVASRRNLDTGKYLSIGNGCNALGGLFGGTVTNNGVNRCTSVAASPTYWSVQTQNRSENGYLGLNYDLNDKTELFADVLFGANQIENNTSGATWTSAATSGGYFYNQNTGSYEQWTKRFAPEEIGGLDSRNKKWEELSSTVTAGIRGDIGDTSWKYEAAYTGSIYTSNKTSQGLVLSNVDTFFLGPKLGVDADGVAIYAPDTSRFENPLTASDFSTISGSTKEKDKAWVQTLSASANGDLFKLPAGTVKLATVAEIGKQSFTIKPDPRLAQGYVYNSTSTGPYGGDRTRQALGAELYVPLAKPLNLTLQGRYDRYDTDGSVIDKTTFGTGLEFRPVKSLLVRGNYQTSFRAPDMNYLYLNTQRGYYSSTTDYYRCAKSGQALSNCEFSNVSPGANYTSTGDKDLQPEEGTSYGLGFVWSPSNKVDISVDYWDVKIDNLVVNMSPDKLLRIESDCRLGNIDINSAQCTDALARIERNPDNAVLDPDVIKNIKVAPINAATERTRGIDVTTRYRWSAERLGNFLWTVNYSRILAHDYQQSASDEKQDLLHDMGNWDWRDRFNTSLGWNLGKWSSTVLINRLGKIPKADQTSYLSPTYLVNWSAAYQISPKASVSVIVNNIFDKFKLDDSAGWPNYPVGNYSPVGRQGWLELNYKF